MGWKVNMLKSVTADLILSLDLIILCVHTVEGLHKTLLKMPEHQPICPKQKHFIFRDCINSQQFLKSDQIKLPYHPNLYYF